MKKYRVTFVLQNQPSYMEVTIIVEDGGWPNVYAGYMLPNGEYGDPIKVELIS